MSRIRSSLERRGGRLVATLRSAEPPDAIPDNGFAVTFRPDSLAASADLVTTYDMTKGSVGGRIFEEASLKSGFRNGSKAEWPSEATLADVGDVLFRDDCCGVFRLKNGAIVYAGIRGGWFRIDVLAPSRELADSTISTFAAAYPPLYRDAEEGLVPITFWTRGEFGPIRRLRMVGAATWAEIADNYTAGVREQLASMMDGFEPGKAGQLILWQGPPGTGKTWALRALASEWKPWAEFHYITDPDSFFVGRSDYMTEVLLSDSYEELTVIDGETEIVSTDGGDKWRVLILEDTGELLAANAKEAYGQGLSRLLNVVDGLVGQGLRVLVLVTTNDELGELHPAVRRPGRCAAAIEFAPLTPEETAAWLGEDAEEGATLAELFEKGKPEPEEIAAAAEPPVVVRVEPEAVERIEHLSVDLPSASRSRRKPNAVLASAMKAMNELVQGILEAEDDEPSPPQQLHVHVGQPNLEVRVEQPAQPKIDVHVPEQKPADVFVTLEERAAPHVEVHVPEQAPAPAPVVNVTVPEATPPPAPEVHVHVPEQPAPVVNVEQASRPRSVRVETDAEGNRHFIAEEEEF